jgi:putative membrane protein
LSLSARLGDGVLNGVLTARVGLSAMAVCRPLPFVSGRAPKVADVAPFVFKSEKKERAAQCGRFVYLELFQFHVRET